MLRRMRRHETSSCRCVALAAWLRALGAAPSARRSPMRRCRATATRVRALLKQGADVSAAQGDGMTRAALGRRARRRRDWPTMLVYAGANVVGGHAHRPVHAAAPRQPGRAARPSSQALLKAGAERRRASRRPSGVTPLHLAAASGSARRRHAAARRTAPTSTRKEAEWGQTPLIFAAALNRVEAIKRAARARRRPERRRRRPSTSRKQSAARSRGQPSGSGRCSRRSVPKGRAAADRQPDAGGDRRRRASCSRPARFRRPRPGAARRRTSATTTSAANSFNPEEINPPVATKGGLTALLHAARQGHLEAARALLDGGADDQPGGRRRRHQPAADGGDQRPVRHGDVPHRARRQPEPRRRAATA